MWRNMKCIIGLAAALLMAACSNDVVEPETGTPDAPKGLGEIVITLPTKKLTTRADDSDGTASGPSHDELHGVVNVNKGKVLIFSTAGGIDDNFLFEKAIDVTFEEKTFEGDVVFDDECETGGKTRMTAETTFTPETGKLYKIYVYAYDENGVSITDDVAGKYLTEKNEKYEANNLAAISVSQALPLSEEHTMEIYGGWVYEYRNSSYPMRNASPTGPILNQISTPIKNYGGSLKRQTGRFELHITGIEAEDNVQSASLIISKYHEKMPVGIETVSEDGDIYYYNPFETKEEVVAKDIPVNNGSLDFCADMIPFEYSNVFVETKMSDGSTIKHKIRVADKLVDATAIGVSAWIVKNSQLRVWPNFWMTLNATYEQLKSNWEIDFNWGTIDGKDGYEYEEELTK